MTRQALLCAVLGALLVTVGNAFQTSQPSAESSAEPAPEPAAQEVALQAMGSPIEVVAHKLLSKITETASSTFESIIVDKAGHFAAGAPGNRQLSDDGDGYDEHVLMSLPSSAALTDRGLRDGALSHFLESPAFRKHMAKQKIRAPSSFVFALWMLYQKQAGEQPHADPLWQAYVNFHIEHGTGEHCAYLWNKEDLETLEQKRFIESASEYKGKVTQQYEQLLLPMLKMFPTFFPEPISKEEFFQVLNIATAMTARVDTEEDTEDVLFPLPLRHHPQGNVRLEAVEQERVSSSGEVRSVSLHHLVSSAGKPIRPGHELTLSTPHIARWNDHLLIEAGMLWNEVRAASHPMRLILRSETATSKKRMKLLKQSKLNETQDFDLFYGSFPDGLFPWMRINLATDDEIEAAASYADFKKPLSEKTEHDIASNLYTSMTGLRAAYDHEIEEDEYLLKVPRLLSPRQVLAIQHRRLNKMVLDDVTNRMAKHMNNELKEEQKRLNDAKGPKGYSSSKERKREAAKKKNKEKRKEEVRRKRMEAAAATA